LPNRLPTQFFARTRFVGIDAANLWLVVLTLGWTA
jgi:hypothetical protein